VKYELGLSIPEDDILHSDRRENVRSYSVNVMMVAIVARSAVAEMTTARDCGHEGDVSIKAGCDLMDVKVVIKIEPLRFLLQRRCCHLSGGYKRK
jgi:hypothetical protein